MPAPPLVSIVTPAFNAAAHIAETARSVLAQTVTDWQWLIADDGSTDATREIVSSIADPRIRLFAGAHSGLPAVGRNRALAAARGTFVAFLDADDVWLPEKLALQLDAIASAGLVFTQFQIIEGTTLQRRVRPALHGLPNPGILWPRLAYANVVCNSSVVLRRALLDAHGTFDEDPRQRGTEDYELWLRLAPHVRFAYVARPLVHYRVHAAGLSRSTVAMTEGRVLAVEKALARTPDAALARELDALRSHWLAAAQSADGVAHCGRRAFLASLRDDPHNTRAWAGLALSFLGSSINRRARAMAERWF